MKLKLLGASALTLAFAFAGAPAASANTAIGPNTSFYLETYSESSPGAPPLCVSNKVVHTDQVWLTTETDSCAVMELINPGSTAGWLEMEITNNSNCFNWVPEGNTGPVESDSCVKGDDNELWYSKYPSDTNTAFENLEGNSSTGHETYLAPQWNANAKTWYLIASVTPFAGWDVVST
jgi:hypothetical protein